tara:strand:+ start:201 stop:500 length:300 start_codon:yes stop_codon:yes gene_type:complete
MKELISKILQWHKDRNLIAGATDLSQLFKLREEVDELEQSILNGSSPVDDIGDIIVVLVNIAERNGLTIDECLEHAYNDIKDRKGRMINGLFVKEGGTE